MHCEKCSAWYYTQYSQGHLGSRLTCTVCLFLDRFEAITNEGGEIRLTLASGGAVNAADPSGGEPDESDDTDDDDSDFDPDTDDDDDGHADDDDDVVVDEIVAVSNNGVNIDGDNEIGGAADESIVEAEVEQDKDVLIVQAQKDNYGGSAAVELDGGNFGVESPPSSPAPYESEAAETPESAIQMSVLSPVGADTQASASGHRCAEGSDAQVFLQAISAYTPGGSLDVAGNIVRRNGPGCSSGNLHGLRPETVAFFEAHPDVARGHRRTTIRIKVSDRGLGLRLFSPAATWTNPHPMGTRLALIVEGGPADLAGGLEVGDVLIEVNGTCVLRATHETVVGVLKRATVKDPLVGARVTINGLKDCPEMNGLKGMCVKALKREPPTYAVKISSAAGGPSAVGAKGPSVGSTVVVARRHLFPVQEASTLCQWSLRTT